MTAYYNENDNFAADWLENLIALGQIAPGDVDRRDIRDVKPDDLKKYTQCHFFAGIGVWSHALRSAGWSDDRPVWTGSCPCQPFSAAGTNSGVDDERHLWPHWFWLISQCRPVQIFGEQVASKAGRSWFDLVSSDLEALDYATGAVDFCAAGVGAPHIRQRLYFTGELADSTGQQRHERLQPLSSGSTERTRGNCEFDRGMGDTNGAGSQKHGELGELHLRKPDGSDSDGQHINTGVPDGMADDNGDGCEPGDQIRSVREEQDSQHGSGTGGVADDERNGQHRGGNVGSSGRHELPDGSGTSGMGDSDSEVVRGRSGSSDCSESRAGDRVQSDTTGTSDRVPQGSPAARPTNGFWRDVDWLYCRDDKWRPVEPGTFPLAHGSTARVGLLRGYGNAIVGPAATAFIEAAQGW